MKPELVDATLKRKQEEKRRQELIDIQHEMGIQTVEEMNSHTQAVSGMIQLQQGGPVEMQTQTHQAINVLQAVQGLQTPLPRHLIQQHVVSQTSTISTEKDDSLLYQALEGRKKVLLELRSTESNKETSKQSSQQLVNFSTQDVTVNDQLLGEETTKEQAEEPLRQQTYYIYHPVSQTFEPITIAQFQENAVIEEVVIAEDYSVVKEDFAEVSNVVANEHDYIEIHDNSEPVHKKPKLSYEQKPTVGAIVRNDSTPITGYSEEVERKPVIAPIVKEKEIQSSITDVSNNRIKIEKVDVEKSSNQTSVIKRLTPELIEETVRNHKQNIFHGNQNLKLNNVKPSSTSRITDLSKVIEETIGTQDVRTPVLQTIQGNDHLVNIEELVDVCFEEEFLKHGDEIIPENEIKSKSTPKVNNKSRKLFASKKRRQSGSLLPLKKRRNHFTQVVSLNSHKIPFMNITVEETSWIEKLLLQKVNFYLALTEVVKKVDGSIRDKRELFFSKINIFLQDFGSTNKISLLRQGSDRWPAIALLLWIESNFKKPNIPAGYQISKLFERSWKLDSSTEEAKTILTKIICGDSKVLVLLMMVVMTFSPNQTYSAKDSTCTCLGFNMLLLLHRHLTSVRAYNAESREIYNALEAFQKLNRHGELTNN